MTDRPIIFSGPMVIRLLAGLKTETRRLAWHHGAHRVGQSPRPTPWQRVAAGDRLWVREGWAPNPTGVMAALPDAAAIHRAGHEEERGFGPRVDHPWRSGRFMPRWASRMTLHVRETWIERLQSISNVDALNEGTPDIRTPANGWDMRDCFARLWDSLHGAGAWDANPEVCVIRFSAEIRNIDR